MHHLIEKLKVRLLLTAPFFATLLLRRPIVEDKQCKTAWTDGEQIGFNPQFFGQLSFDECLAVLIHELLHIAGLHHARQGPREHKRWNYATDYCINLILKDEGFVLVPGSLVNEKFRNMSPEEIYEKLDDSDMPPTSDPFIGEVRAKQFKSQQERDNHISSLKEQIVEAIMNAKNRGKVPASFQRFVEILDQASINWKQALAAFLTEQFRGDYSFSAPNRRYLAQGVYLPSMRSIQRGKFILAVDTSGSITDLDLKEITPEVMDILALSADPLLVLYFDSEIASTQTIEDSETTLLAKGYGGTCYKPVIAYIEREQLSMQALIYFTDGCCDSFGQEPDYPVLWVTKNLEFKPPYGEVIIYQAA